MSFLQKVKIADFYVKFLVPFRCWLITNHSLIHSVANPMLTVGCIPIQTQPLGKLLLLKQRLTVFLSLS